MAGARLTMEQRRVVERGYRAGLTQRQIAAVVGKHPSTISRELARSFSAPGKRPRRRAWPVVMGRATGGPTTPSGRTVAPAWTPAEGSASGLRTAAGEGVGAVAGRLVTGADLEEAARTVPEEPADACVPRSELPRSLFIQTKGELKRELTAHLRSGRQARKPHTGRAKRATLGITGAITIRARPAEVEDRAVPGHWEDDLLLGSTGEGAVITLVERSSRYVLLAPLPGRHTAELARMSLTEMIATLPLSLRKSITWDGEPVSRSPSATPTRPGNAARTRAPLVCCATTGPRARTYAA